MQDTQKPVVAGDTYSYRGWLVSDKFLKRAFAIMGHYFVASMIVFIPLYVLFIGVMLAIFGAGGFSERGENYGGMDSQMSDEMMREMNNYEVQPDTSTQVK